MGNAERKFRDSMYRGDEYRANHYYFNHVKKITSLKSVAIDPNSCVSKQPGSLTLFQCSALHAMDRLYYEFLRKGGNINSVTENGATICHLICTSSSAWDIKKETRHRMLCDTLEAYYPDPSQLVACIDAKDKVSYAVFVWCVLTMIRGMRNRHPPTIVMS